MSVLLRQPDGFEGLARCRGGRVPDDLSCVASPTNCQTPSSTGGVATVAVGSKRDRWLRASGFTLMSGGPHKAAKVRGKRRDGRVTSYGVPSWPDGRLPSPDERDVASRMSFAIRQHDDVSRSRRLRAPSSVHWSSTFSCDIAAQDPELRGACSVVHHDRRGASRARRSKRIAAVSSRPPQDLNSNPSGLAPNRRSSPRCRGSPGGGREISPPVQVGREYPAWTTLSRPSHDRRKVGVRRWRRSRSVPCEDGPCPGAGRIGPCQVTRSPHIPR